MYICILCNCFYIEIVQEYIMALSVIIKENPTYFIFVFVDCLAHLMQNLAPEWFVSIHILPSDALPDSKVHGANMGPIVGRQDPCGPHVGPMNFAIWAGAKRHQVIVKHDVDFIWTLYGHQNLCHAFITATGKITVSQKRLDEMTFY